jgi:hypothetical protein
MKNAAAVALGRKGGRKGGLARAAMLTPEQRSQSARNAVMARWARTKTTAEAAKTVRKSDVKAKTSDETLLLLLNRLKKTTDLKEIRRLSDQIERVIFHKQFANA